MFFTGRRKGELFALYKTDVKPNKITFDNYTYKLGNNSSIGNVEVNVETLAEISEEYNNSFLNIKIPIYNSNLENEDLCINLVYPFNSSVLTNFSI